MTKQLFPSVSIVLRLDKAEYGLPDRFRQQVPGSNYPLQIGVKQRRVKTDGARGIQRPCSAMSLSPQCHAMPRWLSRLSK
jgi:hypothetical protein